MKKSVVIILSVAIIGVLAVYAKSHKSSANTSATNADASNSAEPEATNSSSASQTITAPAPNTLSSSANLYKDGTYDGNTVSTVYGDVRIRAIISGGKIIDIEFLTMPDSEGRSREISNESKGLLKQSTIFRQNAHVDFVSGATQTSEGYEQSLQSALDRAV